MNLKYIQLKDILDIDYGTISSCLYGFQTWYENDDSMLIEVLYYLNNNESMPFENFGIILGNDTDEIEESTSLKINEFMFYFLETKIILNDKEAVKFITDWCAENTTNPEIPALCEQLKQKYEVE